MLEPPARSIRCAWCNQLVDPKTVQQVPITEEEDSELVTSAEPVCQRCLECWQL
jgi:hypothetical protein